MPSLREKWPPQEESSRITIKPESNAKLSVATWIETDEGQAAWLARAAACFESPLTWGR